MDRQALGTLANFCAFQQGRFDARAWIGRGAADPKAYAVAAKYLSMTSWYGHEEELERVCVELCPHAATGKGFSVEAQAIGFDLTYFSASTRYRIALRNLKPRLDVIDSVRR